MERAITVGRQRIAITCMAATSMCMCAHAGARMHACACMCMRACVCDVFAIYDNNI